MTPTTSTTAQIVTEQGPAAQTRAWAKARQRWLANRDRRRPSHSPPPRTR